MNEFFKKYILKSAFIIIGFFFANILLFLLFMMLYNFSLYLNKDSENLKISEIIQALDGSSEDRVRLDNKLKSSDAFFFVLNEQGDIVESGNLPEELNHHYTIAQIVSFTRWYLEDYPVTTRIMEDGRILVLGYPKDSFIKYSFSMTPTSLFWEILVLPFFLLGNLLLFLGLQIFSTKRLHREIAPITDGIEKLANGEEVYLNPKGQLLNVKEKLNRSSELLKKKENARRDWVNGISHDIRTPLSVISNSAELLEKRGEHYPTELILSNVRKIKDLIEQLNLENRLSFGTLPLKLEPVYINLYLSDCLISFLNENQEFGCSIDFEISPEFENVKVLIDKEIFSRALYNIFDNTFSHNPKGSSLKIKGSLTEDKVRIIIKDDGVGISQTELDTLLVSNCKENKRGLGLKLVKKIVSAHNGCVNFTSEYKKGFTSEIILEKTKNP